jgi:mono/diheme cytochrome c family protein
MHWAAFMRTCLAVGAIVLGAFVAGIPAEEKDEIIDAATIFKVRCAMCHGSNGDSKLPGMSFVDGEWKHGNTLKDVTTVIRTGVEGTAMLPFEGRLKNPEIDALARYVRGFDRKLKPGKSH